MVDSVALTVSALSLAVSSVTAWLTLFRRGTIKMTQPTVIFFGPDATPQPNGVMLPKIFIRMLLFSTSKRGRVVESMHIRLSRNETHQNFNVWVYGERNQLVRGSGLFVGETGVSANHHFLTPKDGSLFKFTEGHYRIDVYAKLLGDKKPMCLFSQALDVSRDLAEALLKPTAGLYFDWGPDSLRYLPHIDEKPLVPDIEELLKASSRLS